VGNLNHFVGFVNQKRGVVVSSVLTRPAERQGFMRDRHTVDWTLFIVSFLVHPEVAAQTV
jgi:hypothetical protein